MGATGETEVLVSLEGVEEQLIDVFGSGTVTRNRDARHGQRADGSSRNEAKGQIFKQRIVDLRDFAADRGTACKADPAPADEGRADDVRIFDCRHLLS